MRRTLFAAVVLLASLTFAAGERMRITHGSFDLPPDGGLNYELCAQAWKADGGAKGIDVPCTRCPGGWKAWNACEDRLRALNDFPPIKR